jgi:hypothetical protein
MNLVFKASNIRKVERESGIGFFELLGGIENLNIDKLTLLLRAGGFSGDDEELDAYFDGGFEKVIADISQGLADCGFLPQEARIQMKEVAKKLVKDSSGEAGKKTK